MSLLGGRDAIQNGRQYGRHLGLHLKLKLIGKTRKLPMYFATVVKYDTMKHFAAFGGVL